MTTVSPVAIVTVTADPTTDAAVTAVPSTDAEVEVFPDTFRGPPGPQGPPGPPGLSGAAATSYKFDFPNPLVQWLIEHNLGCYPSVTLLDTANDLIDADIKYLDANNVLVTFSAPTAGSALIN